MTTFHIEIQIPHSYVLQWGHAKCRYKYNHFPIFCEMQNLLAILSEYDILNSNPTSRGIWLPHSPKWGLSHLHFLLGIFPLGASVTNLQVKREHYIFNLFWVTIWGVKMKIYLCQRTALKVCARNKQYPLSHSHTAQCWGRGAATWRMARR